MNIYIYICVCLHIYVYDVCMSILFFETSAPINLSPRSTNAATTPTVSSGEVGLLFFSLI